MGFEGVFMVKYYSKHQNIMLLVPLVGNYFKENFRVFDALDFIALITCHIPPKHKQLIRRYGVYASRSKGKWET